MDKINILIVEDMALTSMEIKLTLLRMGYGVTDIVSNYDDALKSIQQKRPNLILLDIDLKYDKDGIELAKTIHKTDTIPFIYLTSDNSDETMLRAAQTNPSAYLSKPFRHEELKSNLLIALNKMKTQNILQDLGDMYFYDKITKNIYYHDIPIHLSSNEKSLLKVLIDAKGTIVPFNIVENFIWGDNPPTAENTLRNLLYRLRSKLKHMTIETISSFGYRLILSS